MRKFDLSLRSSRSSYFATFRHQLTILSKTDALDEEKWLNIDRKSGSAGMPRPISYAVFCLKKKKFLIKDITFFCQLRKNSGEENLFARLSLFFIPVFECHPATHN